MGVEPVEYQFPMVGALPEVWTLTLNRYQRDNLLWLLQLVGGWPWNVAADRQVAPFSLANTGDWVGEIAGRLATGAWVDDTYVARYDPKRPNHTVDQIRGEVQRWKAAP